MSASRRFAVALTVLAVLASSAATAAGFQSVTEIRAAALSLFEAGADAEASVDAGVRMPACAMPLRASLAAGSSVEVSCPQPAGWRLFVPVKVRRNQDVLVLRHGIATGQTITEADIVIERRDASRIAGAVLATPTDALGKTARRVLSAGNLLSASDLISPRLVRRGDIVALVSRHGGLEVRMSGRALADAGRDERVAVENASSRRIVQGTVDASGAVIVSR